jgi:hypothetical protein
MGRFSHIVLAVFFFACSFTTFAADETILTVTAKGCCSGAGSQTFTLAQLDALPQTTVVTTTPWTEGKHSYRGVRLSELLKYLGIQTKQLKAHALNDYWATVPTTDASQYPVILATRQDGKVLTRRNKGPIFIVYPLTDYPELDQEKTHSVMVWQLDALSVE